MNGTYSSYPEYAATPGLDPTVAESGYDGFGKQLSIADWNGDGYADIATTAPSSGYRVYILNSSGSAGITITAAGSASVIISGSSGFGTGVW